MESRRQKYYKSYTNVDAENGSTANRRSTRRTSANLKRKGENTSLQDGTQCVSKLRRANTAEYVATGLPPPGYLGNVDTPQHVNTQLDPILNETHFPKLRRSPRKLDTPVIESPREDIDNSSSLQHGFPPKTAPRPVNQTDQTKNHESSQSKAPDPLAQSFDIVKLDNTAALVSFHPISSNIPADRGLATSEVFTDTSPGKPTQNTDSFNFKSGTNVDILQSLSSPFFEENDTAGTSEKSLAGPDLPVDNSFVIMNLEGSSPKQSNRSVDDNLATKSDSISQIQSSFETITFQAVVHEIQIKTSQNKCVTTTPLEGSSQENADPSIDDSSTTTAPKGSSSVSPNLPVNVSSLAAAPRNSSPINPSASVNATSTAIALKDSSSVNPDLTQNENSSIHGALSKNEENEKTPRDKEIETCLQEIRKCETCETKEEIPEGCELNHICVELELEEEDEKLKNSSTTNEKVTKKTRPRKGNKELQYQYIDFLSDDECFVWSSSSWDDDQVETESSSDLTSKKKRKKKNGKKNKSKKKKETNTGRDVPVIDPETIDISVDQENSEKDVRKRKKRINKAKERNKLRNSGQEYLTKTGEIVDAKKIKENPCLPGKCSNNCYDIPEEKRQSIFNHYWSLSRERRSDWIVSHSKREPVKRKRVKDVESRRQWSHTYYINDGEGQKQVCLKFLLNTLDVRQKFVHFTIENAIEGATQDDRRGKHVPRNKTSEELMQSVRTFIQNLPAVPSHYCRKNTKKCYLPQDYKNLSNLYRIYKETKQKENAPFVGEKVFKTVFNTEYNISFHVPRKDKCMKCIKYENEKGEELENEKKLHLADKDETYARFEIHQKANEQDPSVLCVTFDLQKVLNTPYGQSMLLYYSRKLAVYNLTFYESKTRSGFCFTWNETQGKRGSNEVCTILSKYIEMVDSRGTIKHLLLYCDSCPGQNKNRVVLACIHQNLQKCTSIVSIQINYLLPGHTYMPVDSMHAVIEKSVANTIIWAPSQWTTVFSLARKTPGPYEVTVLTHKDFEAWDAVTDKYFKGNLVGKISKVRTATMKKSKLDTISIKYSMATNAEAEIVDILVRKELKPKKCYKAPLPISKQKYADLLKLCTNKTIPEMYRHEFIDLPNATNVQDALPESDIEDEDLN